MFRFIFTNPTEEVRFFKMVVLAEHFDHWVCINSVKWVIKCILKRLNNSLLLVVSPEN